MYAILILQLHFPPDYVLDRMEMYEVKSVMKYQHYSIKEDWEQARFISYLIAASNSTKKLKITDILKFPWDNEKDNQKHVTSISNEDIKRLKEKAQQYLNSNNINN